MSVCFRADFHCLLLCRNQEVRRRLVERILRHTAGGTLDFHTIQVVLATYQVARKNLPTFCVVSSLRLIGRWNIPIIHESSCNKRTFMRITITEFRSSFK